MPTPEVFPNLAIGFLSGNITSSATSISLNSGHTLPATGNYMVKIDNEIIQVTAVATNTVTAVRAQESTTGATHSAGAVVYGIITSGSLSRLHGQQHGGTLITQRPNVNFVDGGGVTWTVADDSGNNASDISAVVATSPAFETSVTNPPAISSFTWENQNSATATNPAYNTNCILLRSSNNSGTRNVNQLCIAVPTAPYTLIAKVRAQFIPIAPYAVGLTWFDGTKIALIGIDNNQLTWNRYTNNSTLAGQYVGIAINGSSFFPTCWIQLKDDNTNRSASFSMDGITWDQISFETRTNTLTPTFIGFAIDCGFNAQAWPVTCLLESWHVTQP